MRTHNNSTEPIFLRESFLRSFFLADVLFSQHCTVQELRNIFDNYAHSFCIHNKNWLDETWNIVISGLFSKANNIYDFNRLLRLDSLFPNAFSDIEKNVLTQKSNAVRLKSEILLPLQDLNLNSILQAIKKKAEGGDADCISLVGFLEYQGIFFRHNIEAAKKKIATAALWNHLSSVLMGASYFGTTDFYSKKLISISRNFPDNESIAYLRGELNISESLDADKIALALDQAFCHEVYDPRRIDGDAMKLINSSGMTEENKYEVIRSARAKESFSHLLPLNTTHSTELVPDLSVLEDPVEFRNAEFDRLRSNLSIADLRDSSAYKPLLLVCYDDLLCDKYKEIIRACLSGSPMVEIELNEGAVCDLSHSISNIFTSAMEKTHDRNTVVIIDHCETLNQDKSAELAGLLKPHNRKHHKTDCRIPVEIDLSGILPVLFARKTPEHSIVECCDVLVAGELSKAEFRDILEKNFEKNKEAFHLPSLSMEESVSDFLFEYSSQTVKELIAKAIGQLRHSDGETRLTVSFLQSLIDKHYTNHNKQGFWGDTTV